MKRYASLFVMAVVMAFCLTLVVGAANAADKIISTTIDQSVTAIDKNGAEYVRLIINEDRTLQGVKYQMGVPVMAFGSLVEKAKAFQPGDTLKAIVSSKEYKGNTSYSVIAFLD